MKGSIGMLLVLLVTSTFGFHTMGLHHMISDHLVKRSPNHIGYQKRLFDPWAGSFEMAQDEEGKAQKTVY